MFCPPSDDDPLWPWRTIFFLYCDGGDNDSIKELWKEQLLKQEIRDETICAPIKFKDPVATN